MEFQYAQERGLVHLDIKPSNALLAMDGVPMLLDFHLARGPLAAGAPASWLGGTPGHMAPEHEKALEAVLQRRLQAARHELAHASMYDDEVINDDLDEAVRTFRSLLQRCGGDRRAR